MPTGKEMCETIVKALKLDNPDTVVTPEGLWQGTYEDEIASLFILHEWAEEKLREKTPNKS